jgi:hypothetical protein
VTEEGDDEGLAGNTAVLVVLLAWLVVSNDIYRELVSIILRISTVFTGMAVSSSSTAAFTFKLVAVLMVVFGLKFVGHLSVKAKRKILLPFVLLDIAILGMLGAHLAGKNDYLVELFDLVVIIPVSSTATLAQPPVQVLTNAIDLIMKDPLISAVLIYLRLTCWKGVLAKSPEKG